MKIEKGVYFQYLILEPIGSENLGRLVYFHGWGRSPEDPAEMPVINALQAEGFVVYAPYLSRPLKTVYSLEKVAEVVADEVDPEAAVGRSMGALIAGIMKAKGYVPFAAGIVPPAKSKGQRALYAVLGPLKLLKNRGGYQNFLYLIQLVKSHEPVFNLTVHGLEDKVAPWEKSYRAVNFYLLPGGHNLTNPSTGNEKNPEIIARIVAKEYKASGR